MKQGEGIWLVQQDGYEWVGHWAFPTHADAIRFRDEQNKEHPKEEGSPPRFYVVNHLWGVKFW